jgi:hypothetical protein
MLVPGSSAIGGDILSFAGSVARDEVGSEQTRNQGRRQSVNHRVKSEIGQRIPNR